MPNELTPATVSPETRFAIVVAKWNRGVTDKLLIGAISSLTAAGILDEAIDVVRVPGSWEIPLVSQRLVCSGQYDALICLGAVVRGETSHDQHINRGVSLALQDISLAYNLPILFGILTCETMEQAVDRAGGKHGNKGAECAEAAIEMVGLLKNLPPA
jgi:6,7-dimethyl-8-ribityllumazine synthase